MLRRFLLSLYISDSRRLFSIVKQQSYSLTSERPRIWSSELKIMKIVKDKSFDKVFSPQLKKLWSIFEAHNYEIRLAGGIVRDLLMGKGAHDVDLATTATPQQMREMFEQEGIRMFNANGEKHGTVSVRIDNCENFEITTLRIDVETTGRHAKVEFTTDWMLDANRRDLTINSLFLDADGTIFDYFDGYKHIKERKVKFVGDADVRIKEDYLRILRYFRFFGVMQPAVQEHDEQIINAIKNNVNGLEGISGERIWMETRKIVTGPLAPQLLRTMLECGVLAHAGLKNLYGQDDLNEFSKIYKKCHYLNAQPMTLISALLKDIKDLVFFHNRVKSSNDEKAIGRLILMKRTEAELWVKELSEAECLMRFVDLYHELNVMDCALLDKIVELAKYVGIENSQQIRDKVQEIGKFPIDGKMLAALGIKSGPNYKHILGKLKQIWVQSEYNKSFDELLENVDDIVKKLEVEPKAELKRSFKKMHRLSDLREEEEKRTINSK